MAYCLEERSQAENLEGWQREVLYCVTQYRDTPEYYYMDKNAAQQKTSQKIAHQISGGIVNIRGDH